MNGCLASPARVAIKATNAPLNFFEMTSLMMNPFVNGGLDSPKYYEVLSTL